MMKNRFACIFVAGAISLAAFASPAKAVPYVIDETLSSLLWGGAIVLPSLTFEAQTPGSDVSIVSGTFNANVTGPMGSETVLLLGSDSIDLADLGVEGLPAIGAVATIDNIDADGSTDGDPPTDGVNGDGLFTVGETNVLLRNDAANATAAFRNVLLTLGGSGTVGSAATEVEFAVLNGWIAANTSIAGADAIEASLVGTADGTDAGIVAGLGYSLVGNVETITIPIQVTFGDIATDGFQLAVTGTIVGVRTIPEPTSGLVLASLATGAFSVVRRRRKLAHR